MPFIDIKMSDKKYITCTRIKHYLNEIVTNDNTVTQDFEALVLTLKSIAQGNKMLIIL